MYMKQIFSILAAMMLCMMPQMASATYYTGACGDNATYSFDSSTGLLYISGEGAMKSYSNSDPAPWWSWAGEIKHILIDEGITEVGSFSSLNAIEQVTMPSSLRVIRPGAFSYTYFSEVNIPEGVTTIGTEAFYKTNCSLVRIPSTVTEIGNGAFSENGALEVYAYWTDANAIVAITSENEWEQPFYSSGWAMSSMTLHVVSGMKAAYQAMSVWQDFGTINEDIYLPDLYIGGQRVALSDIDDEDVVHSAAITQGIMTYRRSGSAAVITLAGTVINQPVTITAEFAAIIIQNDCRIVVPSGNALTFAGENKGFEINNGNGIYNYGGDQLLLHTDGNGAALAVKANKKDNAAVGNGYKVVQHKKVSDSGDEHGPLRVVLESAQGTGILIDGANEGCDGAILELSTRDEQASFTFYAAGKQAAHDAKLSITTKNNIVKMREGEEAGMKYVEYKPQSSQGIEEVQREPSGQYKCTKVIENGVLYLMYEGTKYDVQGRKVY